MSHSRISFGDVIIGSTFIVKDNNMNKTFFTVHNLLAILGNFAFSDAQILLEFVLAQNWIARSDLFDIFWIQF
jgi:hypothetical protein